MTKIESVSGRVIKNVLFLLHMDEICATKSTDKQFLRDAKALGKVKGKLEQYAASRSIARQDLRMSDVCTSTGELHPKLRSFIDEIPRQKGQADKRHKEYKEEIVSNIARAVRVVRASTGSSPDVSETVGMIDAEPKTRHEHPVLASLFEYLPRIQKNVAGRFTSSEYLTKSGWIIYNVVSEILKLHSDVSLEGLLLSKRHLLRGQVHITTPPDKWDVLESLCNQIAQEYKKRNNTPIEVRTTIRVPLDKFPSPLREQMRVLEDATRGRILPDLRERAIKAGEILRKRDNISFSTYKDVIAKLGDVLGRCSTYKPGEALGILDLLKTEKTLTVDKNDSSSYEYYNKFYTPYRESERERVNKYGGTFDSDTFKIAISRLLTAATYIGEFEHHATIREAFKIRVDDSKKEQRKTEKKKEIDRHLLLKWVGDNFPIFERIVREGTFKRELRTKSHGWKESAKSKGNRSHPESDSNCRFVLYYMHHVTLIVMGYRQRQLRCAEVGKNIIVAKSGDSSINPPATSDTVILKFSETETKNGKALFFRCDLATTEKTHGTLIRAYHLYHKYVLPYIHENFGVQVQAGNGKESESDPKHKFFFVLRHNGKFMCHNSQDSLDFYNYFVRAARRYLKDSGLSKEALIKIHPHYFRGAAMDIFIIDYGGSFEAAGNYFGDDPQTIRTHYKDKSAAHDATRNVVQINKELDAYEESANGSKKSKQMEELEKRLKDSEGDRERLRRADQENTNLLAAANARIESLQLNIASLADQQKQSMEQQTEQFNQIRQALENGNRFRKKSKVGS